MGFWKNFWEMLGPDTNGESGSGENKYKYIVFSFYYQAAYPSVHRLLTSSSLLQMQKQPDLRWRSSDPAVQILPF